MKDKKFIYWLSAFVAGLAIGHLNDFKYGEGKPIEIFHQDLNQDGRKDFVVKTEKGTEYMFIQQEDESYMTLDQIEASIDSTLNAKEKSLEEKIK